MGGFIRVLICQKPLYFQISNILCQYIIGGQGMSPISNIISCLIHIVKD